MVRCADRRYWKYGHLWSITLNAGDMMIGKTLPTDFLLESRSMGKEAYDQAQNLIKNMEYHVKHVAFQKLYKLKIKNLVPKKDIRDLIV
jgi:hypothetical protein